MCARVPVDPGSVDLPETQVFLGWDVPGRIPLFPSPSAMSLFTSSSPLLLLTLVPGCGGMGGTFRRPGAFAFSFSFPSSCPNPSVRALSGPPFPLPRRLLPLHLPSPPPGPICIVRCSSFRVLGATLVHRTRHQQDTQLRRAQRKAHHVVFQDNWWPQSQQAPPAWQTSCAGAVVFAAGAVPSSLPLSAPFIFNVTDAGFCSPSSSVLPLIARGEFTEFTTVQNGA